MRWVWWRRRRSPRRVEFVEALTIVLAMGTTRGWRSTWAGVGAALVALAVITALAGYALQSWLPEALLQLVVGTLLLIFGLQWLRKAILRVGRPEGAARRGGRLPRGGRGRAARPATSAASGSTGSPSSVSFKGVFLEGLEVVFIVITFGLNADSIPLAVLGAAIGGVIVARGRLSRCTGRWPAVPENTIKFVVGLLLTTFGTFWAVEGLGVFAPDDASLRWPGGDAALLVAARRCGARWRWRYGQAAGAAPRRGRSRECASSTGFARFWWDFIVGDDWRIAAGVVVVLAAGALLVAGTSAPDGLVAALMAVGHPDRGHRQHRRVGAAGAAALSRHNARMSRDQDLNVVGGELLPCSRDPVTGFYRDGCCATGPEDVGSHTVCAVMTAEFLEFSAARRQRPVDAAPGVGLPGALARRSLVRVRGALARGARGRLRAGGRARRDARAGARGGGDRRPRRPRRPTSTSSSSASGRRRAGAVAQQVAAPGRPRQAVRARAGDAVDVEAVVEASRERSPGARRRRGRRSTAPPGRRCRCRRVPWWRRRMS